MTRSGRGLAGPMKEMKRLTLRCRFEKLSRTSSTRGPLKTSGVAAESRLALIRDSAGRSEMRGRFIPRWEIQSVFSSESNTTSFFLLLAYQQACSEALYSKVNYLNQLVFSGEKRTEDPSLFWFILVSEPSMGHLSAKWLFESIL